jgi:hypothetical protein
VSLGCPSPQSTARGMPWMLPEGLVSGVLKSAWASTQMTPTRPRATPETEPMAREWSPPRTMGKTSSGRVMSLSLSSKAAWRISSR